MNTTQIKEHIHNYINQADDRFIHLIYGMVKEDKKESLIYTVQGKLMTQHEYKTEIDEAKEQYKNGEFITNEELEKRIKKW